MLHRNVFSHFDCPIEIVSDWGKHFLNKVVKDFVNNGCMFLLVISHFLIHVVTHASVHMTHDEGRKFLEPTPPRKVFYYLCS